MDAECGIAVFLAILCGFCFGAWLGDDLGTYRERRTAIECGAAEYQVDPQTGKTWFVWKDRSKDQ